MFSTNNYFAFPGPVAPGNAIPQSGGSATHTRVGVEARLHAREVWCWASLSLQAGVTEHHRLGGLYTADAYFSQFWGQKPKIKVRQIWCLLTALFLVRRQLSSVSKHDPRGKGAPRGLFCGHQSHSGGFLSHDLVAPLSPTSRCHHVGG